MKNPYEQYEADIVGKELAYKKDFCKIIDEIPKTGKARELHISKLQQYMDIYRENGKIYVGKIYDENEIQLIEGKSKYSKHIEDFMILFLSEMAKKDINSVVMTNRDILELATIVNKNYFKGFNNFQLFLDCFKDNYHINSLDIADDTEDYIISEVSKNSNIFFSSSYRLLKRIITNALCLMEKKSLIIKNTTFVLYNNYKQNGIWHSERTTCTDEQISKILEIQNLSIQEMNDILIDDYFALIEEKKGSKLSQDEIEYYKNKAHTISSIKETYLLNYKQKRMLKYIQQQKFDELFVGQYTNYSTAYDLKLATKVAFQNEIETRKFDKKRLKGNIIEKLENAKDLSEISPRMKKQLIDVFIK